MNQKSTRSSLRPIIAGLLMVTGASVAGTALAQSAEKGRELFMQRGCWGCHGTVGQGGVHGLKLAPDPKPLAYFEAFVRNTMGIMPPYSERVLPKQELADIHAWLQSIPKPADYRTIPLLKLDR
jgi:ubiquinol-cytochrome c reductase cytochrome c subunit